MIGLICSPTVEAGGQKLLGAVHWNNTPLFLVASGFELELRTEKGNVAYHFDGVRLVDCDSEQYLLLITDTGWILCYPDGTRKTGTIADPHPFLNILGECRRIPLMEYPVAMIPGRVPELLNVTSGDSIRLPALYRFETGQYTLHDLSSVAVAGNWAFVQEGDGFRPIQLTSMTRESRKIDTTRALNSVFVTEKQIVLWTVGGERIEVDVASATRIHRKREEADRNSAIFRLPMGAEADIPVRVDIQNSGFMGALDALNAGTIGLSLSVFAGTDREQSWDFSVSVMNPDTFFVSAVRESGCLVFRFTDKTIICYAAENKIRLVELTPQQSFAVCRNQLYVLRDGQVKRHDTPR